MVNVFFSFKTLRIFTNFTHLDLGKENTLMEQRFQNIEENNSYKKKKEEEALRFCHKPFNSKWKTAIKAKLLLWGILQNNPFSDHAHRRRTAHRVPKSWTNNSGMNFLQAMSTPEVVRGWSRLWPGGQGRGAGSGKTCAVLQHRAVEGRGVGIASLACVTAHR